MELPISISPNPLISSTIEIRFNDSINEKEILNLFYPIFNESLPTLRDANFPVESINDLGDRNIALHKGYVFSNPDFSLGIGKNNITFQSIGEYKYWKSYFAFITEKLKEIEKINIFKNVSRVGLRYISIFSGVMSMKEALINSPDLHMGSDYDSKWKNWNTSLKKNEIELFINITEGANFNKGEKKLTGLYIDIDASQSEGLPEAINEDLFKVIDKLHTAEKTLFFGILNKSFTQSLNPVYN